MPRLPPGMIDDVGHFPVELLHDLDRQRLLSLEAQAVHRVRQVDALFRREALHDRHAAVEVGVERQHQRAVGERLHQLRRRHLGARQDDHGRDPGGGGVGGERRRRVTGRRARHRADAHAVGDHLLDHRDEHGHAEILERPGVRVAAHLHPQVLDAELAAVAFRPEDVGAAFVHRHHVLVADAGADPFLLAPDTRSVRPRGPLVAVVEQPHPGHGTAMPQRIDVVDHLEQAAARRTVIERLPDLEWSPGQPAEQRKTAL